MTDPIDPIERAQRTRRQRRRADDPPPHDAGDGRQPLVVVSPPRERPRGQGRPGWTEFVAHLMGQSAQKRGLASGQPTLDEARSTYLGTEYSGPADRRPRAGRVIKTKI